MKQKPLQTDFGYHKKGYHKKGYHEKGNYKNSQRKRTDIRSLFGLIILTVFTLLYFAGPAQAADAMADEKADTIQVKNPASDLWRAVRQRDGVPTDGTTQMRNVDAAILINPAGEPWRQFRMDQLVPIGGYVLVAVLAILALFFAFRGRVRIAAGFSNSKLLRYTLSERTIHWFMAATFIILALTGLIILFGRLVIIPWMGNEAFSPLASFSKVGHDLIGPLFALALILMFLKFVSRNLFARGDMNWVMKGGGMIGKEHPPAGFFNAGEKTIFWLTMIVGVVITVSGFVLLFANFGQGRETMELSHMVHGIAVLALIAVIFGHIYLGTVGMEGAIEGMTSGYCDLNWAKEHHSEWAREAESEALTNEEVERLRGNA